ncbi:MAG: lipoyl(octanoyl) transferase [Candidimonas sp.]|nr:MAG: lipoyl(octanoyl) transferase [Candidimonas sp.]TAM25279.1 MAG: lipoyl(octanoyl) transferase [Candidimonas sp.]TAM75805.1 MAG: lipoyl(octanoyl) transferase [Candidimonas sp.]
MVTINWRKRPAEYLEVWQAMQAFTEARDGQTPDEIWLVEHRPVYTLGQAGRPEHILHCGSIPVVQSNRGGQVTYHGPGQVLAYCLIDLRRLGIYAKEYVELLENGVIGVLKELGLTQACRKSGAPGVYVPVRDEARVALTSSLVPWGGGDPEHEDDLAKIAALGIKIRHGCAYHGVALNVAMDLSPFLGINPCGYEGLRTVDLQTCGISIPLEQAGDLLALRLSQAFEGYSEGRRIM